MVSNVAQFSSSSAGGGITNSGTISGGYIAVDVYGISTLASGIVNQSGGTIAGGAIGIDVSNVAQFGSSSAGGITNSGTISGSYTGIYVYGTSTFAGGINNNGTISGGYIAVDVYGISTFAGGIVNQSGGTIGRWHRQRERRHNSRRRRRH